MYLSHDLFLMKILIRNTANDKKKIKPHKKTFLFCEVIYSWSKDYK